MEGDSEDDLTYEESEYVKDVIREDPIYKGGRNV